MIFLPPIKTVDNLQSDLIHLNETLRRTRKALILLVGIQAIERNITTENSRILHEQASKGKKANTHKFNEVRQLTTSSGKKERSF